MVCLAEDSSIYGLSIRGLEVACLWTDKPSTAELCHTFVQAVAYTVLDILPIRAVDTPPETLQAFLNRFRSVK